MITCMQNVSCTSHVWTVDLLRALLNWMPSAASVMKQWEDEKRMKYESKWKSETNKIFDLFIIFYS